MIDYSRTLATIIHTVDLVGAKILGDLVYYLWIDKLLKILKFVCICMGKFLMVGHLCHMIVYKVFGVESVKPALI